MTVEVIHVAHENEYSKDTAVLPKILICTSFELEYVYAGSCKRVIRFLTTSEGVGIW
jgi:hypothetical protein